MFERVADQATFAFLFSTHNSAGGIEAPSSAFDAADVKIYKDGSATQRSSANGLTMTSPFDSITGLHKLAIDLSDDTDSGFYAVGSRYEVVLDPDETVDGQSVGAVIARFRIVPAEASAGVPDVNVASMDAGVVTASAVATGAIDADAIASDAITAAKIATDAIGAAELAADAVNEIADQVWDELLSGHTTGGSAGQELADAADGAQTEENANILIDRLMRRSYDNIRGSVNGQTVSRRTLLGLLAQFVNSVQVSGANLVVRHEDDSEFYTMTLTTDPGADPITRRD